MTGVQGTLKDGLVTPANEILADYGAPIPVPGGQGRHREASSPRYATDAPYHSTAAISKSWNDNPVPRSTIAFSSAGHVRRPTFSQIISPGVDISEKKVLMFDGIAEDRCAAWTTVWLFCIPNYLSTATRATSRSNLSF
jgi:hypothetical protein